MDLFPLKYLETTSVMVYLIESCEYGTAYGNIDGLFDGVSMVKEDETEMGSTVRVVYGKLNMSNLDSVIWVS